MPDATTTDAATATDATSTAGTTTTDASTGAGHAGSTSTSTTDATSTSTAGDDLPESAKALIAKLREKEKQGEKDAKALRDAQTKLDEIERAKLSDAERLQAERDEARADAEAAQAGRREDRIRLAVYGQRDALGLSSADLAIAALDRSAVEFDDEGQPTNITDLLTALIEREPVLKGTPAKPVIPSTDAGAGAGGKAPDLTADELEAARLLGQTPERFAALKRIRRPDGTVQVSEAIAAITTQ